MNTFIALFRGINVGGNNILPMKELTAILTGLGLRDVKTYIQSGNVVFRSEKSDIAELSKEITAAVDKSHGFAPRVLLLPLEELKKAIDSNPFPEGESDPKTLHLFFLSSAPAAPDFASLEKNKAASEKFRLIGAVFYLHAPDGIGRSKLATSVEKAMGVAATARNWRSVTQILAMAEEVAA